jgi:hypothetical protein
MHALVESGSITKIFTNPKGFVLNNTQYPADIFSKWTKAEKEAIGIYEVITDSTNKKDEEYFINTNEEYNYADNQVTRSWGTATPKRLEDEDAKDEDGNNILDEDGNQVINYGLKTIKKRIIKQQASGLLAPTDWYVVKATEVEDYNVPENITTYRAEVRAKSNEMETQIDACTNVDELKTLYEYTEQEDGTITRPLAEFPVLES